MVISSIISTSNRNRTDNKLKVGLVVVVIEEEEVVIVVVVVVVVVVITIIITVMILIAVIKSIRMVLVEPGGKIRSESRVRRSCKNKAVFIGATMKYKN